MSEPTVFDPRDSRFKTPFGAVPCGRCVTLTCRPPLWEGFSHCSLLLHGEFADFSSETPLLRQGDADDRAVFSVTVPLPAAPELVWYHFRLSRDDGSGCLLDTTGYRSEGTVLPWQQTVYDDAVPTPDWFGRGVTYQIFPDRFARLSVPSPEGLVGNRRVHENWDEAMDFLPDPDGEVRNCDFFGGSLQGILSKLDDLAALSVTTLYLCPIFESASNHRYNTADYLKIDPMLGTESDFTALCTAAAARGMRVILDGVFNHTGSDSVYFNQNGFYPTLGAAQSPDSPYFGWYHFTDFPHSYDAWWGIRTLPAVCEDNPAYGDFIIENQDSVLRHWLRAGASGWRLDVADELPDAFIARMRSAMAETKPDSILLGEVWEDGSNKIAYSQRRRYLLGNETHGLMNYPFRTAALAYLLGGDASAFRDAMETLREHYPPPAFYAAMNFLGTHDTPRILTALGASTVPETKTDRAAYRLSEGERDLGLRRLRLAALLLYTFPGSPTVYYGDEAGMEGFEDPFNRATYPWGHEDAALRDFFRRLGGLRRTRPSLQAGDICYFLAEGHGLAFARRADGQVSLTAINAGDAPLEVSLPWESALA
ncbi:MAG: glycoside hydrolase family 13 protein, partial [Oscillospiraceae bacterium]